MASAQAPLMAMAGHDSHPSFGRLVMLVFEAVMEVVCVSLPGYIIARLGHFDADKQRFLANLNVMLFTPCLIFTKLASQLDGEKFVELGVIPVIFVVMTLVSYAVSVVTARLFGFNKRASNFVTAMGVFGNSNSLPISLVLSLSQTLKGLHWSKVPGDNDDEVASRGILYLMIFQQLGQVVRWSWGYHVLLAPKSAYPEYQQDLAEEGQYRDALPEGEEGDENDENDDENNTAARPVSATGSSSYDGLGLTRGDSALTLPHSPTTEDSERFEPNGRTPVAARSRGSTVSDETSSPRTPKKLSSQQHQRRPRTPGGNSIHTTASSPTSFRDFPEDPSADTDGGILSFPRIRNESDNDIPRAVAGMQSQLVVAGTTVRDWAVSTGRSVFGALPPAVQTCAGVVARWCVRFVQGLWAFMNPPLWAMLLAVIVASSPTLKAVFFEDGSFIKNSVTSAVTQSAGVAVPLILVVLGANLARNTQPQESHDAEESAIGTRLLVASLLCRMLLPTLVMAPVLALFAKYVPVSILGDPIFVIVCFLLTGAPSALQLAQICQINGVYERTMSQILFQSYVIWIMPSTLVLVMCALEVVEWAAAK